MPQLHWLWSCGFFFCKNGRNPVWLFFYYFSICFKFGAGMQQRGFKLKESSTSLLKESLFAVLSRWQVWDSSNFRFTWFARFVTVLAPEPQTNHKKKKLGIKKLCKDSLVRVFCIKFRNHLFHVYKCVFFNEQKVSDVVHD